MSKQTILVTGANGQLGNEFRVLAKDQSVFQFLFTTREELSIADASSLAAYFNSNKIDHCINCAAYTAVDKAEAEKDAALLINGEATGHLASVCKQHGATFIHISTDYVFDGTATTPYLEHHPTGPVGSYGISKLKGEELAQVNNPASVIIRTSWVYSSFGNNFVKTMLRLMKERESINVVSDQTGRPTYAADLAQAIMQIIHESTASNKPAPGIYHFSNTGDAVSWFEFAMAIKELSGSKCLVNPIPTSAYPTPAKRPGYSVMDTKKIETTFGIAIPDWRSSLERCLKLLL